MKAMASLSPVLDTMDRMEPEHPGPNLPRLVRPLYGPSEFGSVERPKLLSRKDAYGGEGRGRSWVCVPARGVVPGSPALWEFAAFWRVSFLKVANPTARPYTPATVFEAEECAVGGGRTGRWTPSFAYALGAVGPCHECGGCGPSVRAFVEDSKDPARKGRLAKRRLLKSDGEADMLAGDDTLELRDAREGNCRGVGTHITGSHDHAGSSAADVVEGLLHRGGRCEERHEVVGRGEDTGVEYLEGEGGRSHLEDAV